VPDAKVVVSLRDPVERLHSTYLMLRNNVPGMGDFGREIERGLAWQGNPSLSVVRPVPVSTLPRSTATAAYSAMHDSSCSSSRS
jgi:hypothetical protein